MNVLPDVVLALGTVGLAAECTYFIRRAVRESRWWQHPDAMARSESEGYIPPDVAAELLAAATAARDPEPTVQRWVHVRRQGDVEEIEAWEVLY